MTYSIFGVLTFIQAIFGDFFIIFTYKIVNVDVKARGGGLGVKRISLAYIKVQSVMELLFFRESQNLLS